MKKRAISTASLLLLALAATPSSAKIMRCSGANVAKLGTMISTMQDGATKAAVSEEMELANAEMNKGHVVRACLHMRKAQKLEAEGKRT